jgi:hypothetical protein
VHLLTAITSHGFGHAAQVAPVLNALRELRPDICLTVQSSLPEAFLRERIEGYFERIDEAPDFGLVMHSALSIDLDASDDAYRKLHTEWPEKVAQSVHGLQALAPDLVLADVPYLTLAAAACAGIPAVALCSLNWADIYRHYFFERQEAAETLGEMEAAYRSARMFLCPEPSMPMPFLDNRRVIAPIAARGESRRAELCRQLGIGADQLLILVAPGGVKTRFPMESWPAGQGIRWLVSAEWCISHPDVSDYQQAGFSFTDLVASCDAVLGKCGYGTVAECVTNGTPLLYIPRPDWPEEQTLLAWLYAHGAALAVPDTSLDDGDFQRIIPQLGSLDVECCEPDGAAQAAQCLLKILDETNHAE